MDKQTWELVKAMEDLICSVQMYLLECQCLDISVYTHKQVTNAIEGAINAIDTVKGNEA